VLRSQDGRPPFHAAAIFGLQQEGRRFLGPSDRCVIHHDPAGLREFTEVHYFSLGPIN
jgi:hypothetical protein